MASSGINRFKWFIFLCLVIGGFLLWQKYSNAMEKIEIKPEVQKTISQPIIELPKPVFLPEEVSYLLHSNSDIRAGRMRDRSYKEEEIKQDNSYLYQFMTKPRVDGYYGYIKFFSHQNFFEIAFNKREDYDIFITQFHSFRKLGASGDCLERYSISDECFACEMEFRRKANSFLVMIMRDPGFAYEKNRYPPKLNIQRTDSHPPSDDQIIIKTKDGHTIIGRRPKSDPNKKFGIGTPIQ